MLQHQPSFASTLAEPPADGRIYARHDCAVPTACQPAAANEARWPAIIRDLSRSGVRLTLGRRFERGSNLAIDVPAGHGQEAYTVFAKVVHVRTLSAGSWALGCKFISELSEDELERMLSVAPPEDTVTTIDDVQLRIEVGPEQIVDCLVQRFHIPGAWPLLPGKMLRLRGVASNGARLEHPFHVVECRPLGEGWTLHVRLPASATAPAWLQAR